MSSISYSSSSFTTIKIDEDCICSIKRFVAAKRSKEIWNVSWIFIDDDKFNWQTFFDNLLILYDFIHLWFNFLNERSILIFLMNNQIMSCSLYSNELFLFLSACLFCAFWLFANLRLIKFQMSFILSVIFDAFWSWIRSLTNSSFDIESKLIRDSKS